MTASFSDERSPLLHPSGSQRFGRIGRRTRLIVSGLALLLLLAGAVSCVAIVLRLLCGSVASAPPSFVTPLVLEQELLSDDPWRRVLLIEAGNASQTQLGGTDAIPSPLNAKGLTPFDVPFYWTNVANTPSLHWAYPDVNVAKALGGCGIHNAMLYVRALPSDLERWQIDKWTWEALTIYMAIEDYDGANSSFHSTGGFVRRYGAGYYHFNTRDGVRESAAKAFLGPILDSKTAKSTRSNFRLMLDTTVTKIRINDDNVTEGVEVRYRNGTEQLIRLAEHEPHMSNSAELNHVTEVIITIALLHPLARNRVVLVHDSDNSVDDNDIDDHLIPRVVSEVPESKPEHLREGDVWKITWAIGVVREIAAKLDEKDLIGKEITPGADVTATKDLEEWVFNSVFRNSHWVGSASMGTSEEKAVVDNHLRVFGIKTCV
ncbi:putative choline dehydrogenase [Phytophthora cinnamomi]|uniref:putative choline dehydrogenase n=1 Tax=Phytophthora cinnamomi TaxID=4785 RepID=UPI003559A509|nr:putative choline dehydrogenase [Phytophthora cinnamomi]